jgi:hypothetical protein
MDCRQLKYSANTFDFIIDKSTIDALLCGDHAYMNVAITMKVNSLCNIKLPSRNVREC